MASNKDMVKPLEASSLDDMFGFNVAMGTTMFLMAWATVCLAVKDFAQTKEAARLQGNESD